MWRFLLLIIPLRSPPAAPPSLVKSDTHAPKGATTGSSVLTTELRGYIANRDVVGFRTDRLAFGSDVNRRRYCAAQLCLMCGRISVRYSPYITRVLYTQRGDTPATITRRSKKDKTKNVNWRSWWGAQRKPSASKPVPLGETSAASDKSRFSFNGNQLVRQKEGSAPRKAKKRGGGVATSGPLSAPVPSLYAWWVQGGLKDTVQP